MRTKALLVILVLLLGTASLALAQERTLGGNVVELKDTTMIFRAEEGEGRIYTVDLAALPANVRESLENHREKVGLGQAIHLVAKPGPTADTLIASRATIDQPDRGWGAGKNRKFLKVVGTVESATGSLVTIKTPQGKVIPMEPSPRLTVARGQSVTVVYEEAPNEKRFLRWVDAPKTASAVSQPAAATSPGQFHGNVLFTSGDTVAIGTDAGSVRNIDVSGLDAQARRSLELGRAVTVTGKPGTAANQPFVASTVRVDKPDVAWGQGPHRKLLKVEGTVESISGSVVNFRTGSGLLAIDVSKTGWKPTANERATIVYEDAGSGGQSQRLARWVERDAPAGQARPQSLSGW